MQTYRRPAASDEEMAKNCRSFNTRLDYKNFSKNTQFIKNVTEGVLVYKGDDGRLTCEATFTIASLYSVLQSISQNRN